MKHFFTALFLLFSFATTSFSQEGYAIKGKIKGWKDTVCYLGNHYGDKQYIKDSTRIDKDGNFVFKGKEKLPGGIYLVVLPNKKYFELLMDKEQHFSVETDTAATKMVENMKVKGSDDNIAFYKYLNFITDKQISSVHLRKRIIQLKEDSIAASSTAKKDSIRILQDKMAGIDKEVGNYKDNFVKEHPASFLSVIFKAQKEIVVPEAPLINGKTDSLFAYHYYKDHFWDNINLADDRLLRSPVLHMKLKYYLDNVVLQHPDSIIKEGDMLVNKTAGNKETFKYVVWYLTTTYETSQIMGMDAVFVHEVEKYYVTKQAYWVDSINIQKIIHRALTLKPLLLGKPAPPIIMQDSSDNNISLYDVRGDYTVLVFWDPDCGHCQKVMPRLKAVYDSTLKSKKVTVYAVDIEDVADKWKKFVVDKKLNWINCHDKYKKYFLRELYDIYSTPVIYLLDENKIIKAKRIDVEQLTGFIEHLEKIKKMEKSKSGK